MVFQYIFHEFDLGWHGHILTKKMYETHTGGILSNIIIISLK